jgi:hypothetical protein
MDEEIAEVRTPRSGGEQRTVCVHDSKMVQNGCTSECHAARPARAVFRSLLPVGVSVRDAHGSMHTRYQVYTKLTVDLALPAPAIIPFVAIGPLALS